MSKPASSASVLGTTPIDDLILHWYYLDPEERVQKLNELAGPTAHRHTLGAGRTPDFHDSIAHTERYTDYVCLKCRTTLRFFYNNAERIGLHEFQRTVPPCSKP
ncbi:MAG: hypothetical protein Q7V62_04885 [Actinomycetota bacterium]|nr:hypothetical protein [Actinomycetota bacterium]